MPRQQPHLVRLAAEHARRTARSRHCAQVSRRFSADPRNTPLRFEEACRDILYRLAIAESKGARIRDVDGNEYVDFAMGFGAHLFGHSPPFLIEALERQLRAGIPVGHESGLAGVAAQMIAASTGMDRMAFCTSGTEAMMVATRLARAATKRTTIAMFEGSYHGMFDGVLARRSMPGERGGAQPAACGTPPSMVADVVVLEYGSPRSLAKVDELASSLAAVLVEPAPSLNPGRQPASFLGELRELTRRASVPLIFDEIVSGFRLHPAGAQGYFGIKADLAAYGKVLGGGLPIGIVAGSSQFFDLIDGEVKVTPGTPPPANARIVFASTFARHPLVVAAAEATLRELNRAGPELQRSLNARTAALVEALEGACADHGLRVTFPSCGSWFRFPDQFDRCWPGVFFFHLLEQGIYVGEGRLCFLSTVHGDRELDQLIAATRRTLATLHEHGFLVDEPSAAS
jgi:iturin family lipopeptide synthetase A